MQVLRTTTTSPPHHVTPYHNTLHARDRTVYADAVPDDEGQRDLPYGPGGPVGEVLHAHRAQGLRVVPGTGSGREIKGEALRGVGLRVRPRTLAHDRRGSGGCMRLQRRTHTPRPGPSCRARAHPHTHTSTRTRPRQGARAKCLTLDFRIRTLTLNTQDSPPTPACPAPARGWPTVSKPWIWISSPSIPSPSTCLRPSSFSATTTLICKQAERVGVRVRVCEGGRGGRKGCSRAVSIEHGQRHQARTGRGRRPARRGSQCDAYTSTRKHAMRSWPAPSAPARTATSPPKPPHA